MSRGLPWAELMSAGLGRLRLPPDVFWNMTIQELDAALAGAFGCLASDTLRHSDLADLIDRFPDQQDANDG